MEITVSMKTVCDCFEYMIGTNRLLAHSQTMFYLCSRNIISHRILALNDNVLCFFIKYKCLEMTVNVKTVCECFEYIELTIHQLIYKPCS